MANAQFANTAQQQQYGQQMGQWNNTMGGLCGLGGALLAPADRRLKRDIVKVGKRGGLNLYGRPNSRTHKGTDPLLIFCWTAIGLRSTLVAR